MDPDPYSESGSGSGSRRSKKSFNEEKNEALRQIIRHKKYKNQCNWYKKKNLL
jgi:hypothetical protein